jgi:uncharacterized membrane protein HdeD (DUF308 family)
MSHLFWKLRDQRCLIISGLLSALQAWLKDEFLMVELGEKEKTRRFIGATLLCIGSLCMIWGDQSNNFAVLKFGKTTAVVGIILYFSGRIGKLLRKS